MTPALKPFIKWAGGKRSLLPQIVPHLPTKFRRYHEPFLGSGALFFHLQPRLASLSDTNARLIRTYKGLRDEPERVIERLSAYPHEKEFFLKMRKINIDEQDDVAVAAWFIYLNKTAYNGLYRVNRQNRFNVPFGSYKNPVICAESVLQACAKRLRRTDLAHGDFEERARRARKGDLVYFDPPYVPLNATSSFTAYTAEGFDMDAQRRLRDLAFALRRRGVHVLLSNSSAEVVREMYQDDFTIVEISARRSINSRGDGRKPICELLITSAD